MTEPIFVAAPDDVYYGDSALARIQATNDLEFLEDDGSVLTVSRERWQQAQEYARRQWMECNRGASNDRNDDHAAQFDHYKALPVDLGEYGELGCGPFTNSRIILKGRTADSVTLVDPLVKDYLEHPYCAYKDGTLAGHPVTTVASTIEAWTRRKKFDTLVLINVLHHCQDTEAVFDKLLKLLKRGSWLVFADYPREHDPRRLYDVGHPLAPHAHTIDAFLDNFEEVYRNRYHFIGRLK